MPGPPQQPEERRQPHQAGLHEHPDELGIHEGEARHSIPKERPVGPALEPLPPAVKAGTRGRIQPGVADPVIAAVHLRVQGVVVAFHDLLGKGEGAQDHQRAQPHHQDQAAPAEDDQRQEHGDGRQPGAAGERIQEGERKEAGECRPAQRREQALGREGLAQDQRQHEDQISTEGVRLPEFSLEGCRHPLSGRDLGDSDHGRDGAGDQDRCQQAPHLAFLPNVIHRHEVDHEEFEVFQGVEHSPQRADVAQEHPQERGQDQGDGVSQDGPVEGGLPDQSQFLEDGRPGEPGQGDRHQDEILHAEDQRLAFLHGLAEGDASDAAHHDLRREEHGQQDDVQGEFDVQEAREEDDDQQNGAQADSGGGLGHDEAPAQRQEEHERDLRNGAGEEYR